MTSTECAAEHWLSEAERLASEMFGRRSGRSGSAFEQVTRNYAQYRRAFDWFADHGDAEQAARLIAALRDYWWARELYTEGEEWIDRVLQVPDVSLKTRATLFDQAGALAFAQAEFGRARGDFEASVLLRRTSGSRRLLALALNRRAAATRWGGSDSDAALSQYLESLAVARDVQDRLLIAAALMPLGSFAIERGDLTEADGFLRQGLAIYVDVELASAYPLALEQFAALAAAGGQAVRALQLAGAGAAWRADLDTYPTPYVAWMAGYASLARGALSAGDAQAGVGGRSGNDPGAGHRRRAGASMLAVASNTLELLITDDERRNERRERGPGASAACQSGTVCREPDSMPGAAGQSAWSGTVCLGWDSPPGRRVRAATWPSIAQVQTKRQPGARPCVRCLQPVCHSTTAHRHAYLPWC
jgi:hypothetical protein